MNNYVPNMTKEDFKNLPSVEDFENIMDNIGNEIEIDSVVLLPSNRNYNTEWRLYDMVLCKNERAIGRVGNYDSNSIFVNGKWERIGIDCLAKSGLMRIFLERNKYVYKRYMHQITVKGE